MLAVEVKLRRRPGEVHEAMRFAFRARSIVTGVFGRSGAGKTTLLHVVAGLTTPAAGSIRLGEEVLFDSSRRIDRPPPRRRIGVAFQDDRLFPHLSVRGNLRYGALRGEVAQGRASGALAFDDVVELLDLGPLLERRVRGLSGGETRRVSLGRAVLSAPRLLLLDEPLSFLDREQRLRILGLIRRIRDEIRIPMLYVSHDLREILQLTEDLLLVHDGRIVGHGPLREVVRDPEHWPAVRALGPLNVLTLVVATHDEPAGLTTLRPASTGSTGSSGSSASSTASATSTASERRAEASVLAPRCDLTPGATVVVSIRPEDIALALKPVGGISIQNQVPGRIVTVTPHDDRVVVEVDAALGPTLLVEVSHRTVGQMAITPGQEVRCLIKSNAIQYADR